MSDHETDDRFSQFTRDFETNANRLAAEVVALRYALQILAATLWVGHPRAAGLFSEWRRETLGRLEAEANLAADQTAKRATAFALASGRNLFDELVPAFGLKPEGSSEPQH